MSEQQVSVKRIDKLGPYADWHKRRYEFGGAVTGVHGVNTMYHASLHYPLACDNGEAEDLRYYLAHKKQCRRIYDGQKKYPVSSMEAIYDGRTDSFSFKKGEKFQTRSFRRFLEYCLRHRKVPEVVVYSQDIKQIMDVRSELSRLREKLN